MLTERNGGHCNVYTNRFMLLFFSKKKLERRIDVITWSKWENTLTNKEVQ